MDVVSVNFLQRLLKVCSIFIAKWLSQATYCDSVYHLNNITGEQYYFQNCLDFWKTSNQIELGRYKEKLTSSYLEKS